MPNIVRLMGDVAIRQKSELPVSVSSYFAEIYRMCTNVLRNPVLHFTFSKMGTHFIRVNTLIHYTAQNKTGQNNTYRVLRAYLQSLPVRYVLRILETARDYSPKLPRRPLGF